MATVTLTARYLDHLKSHETPRCRRDAGTGDPLSASAQDVHAPTGTAAG
jgi:hypothetical protein